MSSRRFQLVLIQIIVSIFVAISQVPKPGSDLDKAYSLYTKKQYSSALKVFSNTGEDEYKSAAQRVIKGWVMMDSVSYEEGLKYFLEAKTLTDKLNDPFLTRSNLFGLGKIYYNIGEFENSIRYFLKLEFEATKHKVLKEQKTANFYLAQNYQRLGKIPISNQYALRAIELAK